MYLSKSQISEGKYVSWLGDQRIATSIKTSLIDGGFPPQIFQIYLKIALYAVCILTIEKTGLNSDEIEGFLATNISGIYLESWETD